MNNIKSRYSLKPISNRYSTISINGNTYSLHTSNNTGLSQGCIFVPYIMSNSISIVNDRELYKKILRNDRINKLNKINSLNEKET